MRQRDVRPHPARAAGQQRDALRQRDGRVRVQQAVRRVHQSGQMPARLRRRQLGLLLVAQLNGAVRQNVAGLRHLQSQPRLLS